MTEFSIIRNKDKSNQYGVVATDKDHYSIALGWFETYDKADRAIERFTGKARIKVQ